jgi:MoxR-like ATPase
MAWPQATLRTLRRLKNVQRILKGTFTERDLAVDLLVLAAVCQEHLLLLGPPGTAKTDLLTRFTGMVEARGFHYLLTRFTEPSEIFGPLDLGKFQKGTYHILTDHMLPDAQVVFLDEVFQGSSAILNSLLTLVNERVFHNGGARQKVPLLTLVGASNQLPDDPWLRAFADRFALRLTVGAVPDERLDDLLASGWQLELGRIRDASRAAAADGGGGGEKLPELKIADLLALHARLAEVDIRPIQPLYGTVLRELRAESVELSDRRAIKGLKLIAGAALLREAETAGPQDLWPLLHVWSRAAEADALRQVVQPRVEEAGGAVLSAVRPVEDILLDLQVLIEQEPALRSEVAISAHLMALNRLRREVLAGHRSDASLNGRIDQVIHRVMARLEEAHV